MKELIVNVSNDNRHLEAFQVILKKTEEAYPKNNDGKTPLDIAVEVGNLQAYIAIDKENNLLGVTKNLYICGICVMINLPALVN